MNRNDRVNKNKTQYELTEDLGIAHTDGNDTAVNTVSLHNMLLLRRCLFQWLGFQIQPNFGIFRKHQAEGSLIYFCFRHRNLSAPIPTCMFVCFQTSNTTTESLHFKG